MSIHRRAAIFAATVLSLVSVEAIACSATTACINEILAEPPGGPGAQSMREYLEFRFTPGAVLPANTYFVAIEGDFQANRNQGSVDSIINLSGLTFGANGFLVLLPAGNTYAVHPEAAVLTSTTAGFGGLPGGIWQGDEAAISYERPSTSFFIINSATPPQLSDDIDADDDGVIDAGSFLANATILDSVGIADNPNKDRSYAAINFRTQDDQSPTTIVIAERPMYMGRFGDSFGSTPAAWAASGALGGTNPNFLLSATTTYPNGLQSKPLNHIGTTNAWLNVAPEVNIDATLAINEDDVVTYAGNLSITDDSGDGDILVTITVTNGTLTLSGTAGLVFTAGDGSADDAMSFTGTLADVNAALNGASFVPTVEFSGDATVRVQVDDQGNTGVPFQALTDDETQTITIANVNDTPISADQAYSVSEDASNGFVLGTVPGTDAEGDTLAFSIATVQSVFAIDSATGVVSLADNSTLDFETTPQYVLSVNVSDGNTADTVAVTIDVLNVDDNEPVVDDQGFSIVENSPNGSAVGTVVASDADGDTLAYSLTAPSTAFALDGATGAITVIDTAQIDFETNPQFTLGVSVSDGSSSDTANVTITVTDSASTDPVVHDQAFSIAENSPNGFTVGTVFAVDEDGPLPLQYSIVGGSTVFALDGATGALTVVDSAALDFETTPSFALTVAVSDGTTSDTAVVTVGLTNVSEIAPVVTAGQTFSIAENSANGSVVGTVVATDAENEPLTFSFVPVSTAFAITAAGEISVLDSAQLDFETTPSFTLTVQASDGTLTGSDSITITVTDVDESDTTAPTALSIARTGANPATSSPVVFAVTFSEAVVGVDSGDFALATTGTVAGAAISSVNCVNDACSVTVTIDDGNGTLGLNLVDDDTIADAAGNALGGTGAGNGNFTGQAFDVELEGSGSNPPPTVVSVTRLNPSASPGPVVAFLVTFSEAVTGVDTSDFALTTTGNLLTPAIDSVTGAAGVYTVAVSTGTGTGTIRLDVMDDDTIVDLTANALGGGGTGNGAFTTGEVYEIDTINGIPIFRDGFENPPSN